MDRSSHRLQFVRFAAKVIIIPPSEYAKEEETRATITQLGRHDNEKEDFCVRRGLQQQPEVKKCKSVDDIAILLAILCSTPICFITGVVAWAANNPRDMCKKAPQLVMVSNRLPAALLTILPGLTVSLVLVWFAQHDKCNERLFERGWTKLRLVLTMVLVALVTILFMPWTSNVETWVLQVDCSA